MSENESLNENPMTQEELDMVHEANVSFLNALLPMLYDNGEDDDPDDEFLIPPETREEVRRENEAQKKEGTDR